MNEKIRKNLEKLATDIGENNDEVISSFSENLQMVKDIIDLNIEDSAKKEEEYEKIAYNKTQSQYKLKKQKGVEELEVVILGIGREVDWAKIQKNNIDKTVKEKGGDFAVKNGLMDAQGNYFYTDEYRKGRKIPETDYSVIFYGATKIGDKIIPIELEAKDKNSAKSIEMNARLHVKVQKNQNKSKDDYFVCRLYSGDIRVEGEIDSNEISQLNSMLFCNNSINFDDEGFKKLLSFEGKQREKVTLKNFTVQNIREGVGFSKSCQLMLDTPTTDPNGFSQVIAYLPKVSPGQAIEGLPVNLFCEISNFDKERKTITVNGFVCWLPPEYAAKSSGVEAPKQLSEDKESW